MKEACLGKPSVGRQLAQALGVHQTHGWVYRRDAYIVTWALGHLVGQSDVYAERWRWNLRTCRCSRGSDQVPIRRQEISWRW